VNTSFLTHSSVVGHLGCLHSLAILNSSTISIVVQGSLLYPDLCCFGNMPRSGVSGSHGSSIFSLLTNLQTAFNNGCTNFAFSTTVSMGSFFMACFPAFVVVFALKLATLAGVR
jgi:hypothetical protein